MQRKYKILATVCVAVCGIAFIAAQSIKDVEYYVHVDALMADPARWQDKKVIQVHGFVAPGSIKTEVRDQLHHQEFRLEWKGKEIAVRHAGSVPDTFKDQAETVAKGKLLREGDAWVLQAVQGESGIMAKCPSKYDGSR